MSSLVSVIIPCYNHERFVRSTIQSVIDQDYDNIELIVIDDGSSDASVEVINDLVAVCKVRFSRFEFRVRENIGLTATLREAVEWCEGVYISPIASDDIMLPCKISTQVKYLDRDYSCAGVFSGASVVDCDENLLISRHTFNKNIYKFKDVFLFNYKLPASTQMLRRSQVLSCRAYDKGFINEDLYSYLKILSGGGYFVTLKEVLCLYRRHESNISRDFIAIAIDRHKVLSEFKNFPGYYKSYSFSLIIEATQLASKSRRKAISCLFKAVGTYPLNIFSLRFLRFFYFIFLTKQAVKNKLFLS